jgi:hypothetical protein
MFCSSFWNMVAESVSWVITTCVKGLFSGLDGLKLYCGVFAPCWSYWSAETRKTRLPNSSGEQCFLCNKPRAAKLCLASPSFPSPHIAFPRFATHHALLGNAVNAGSCNYTERYLVPSVSSRVYRRDWRQFEFSTSQCAQVSSQQRVHVSSQRVIHNQFRELSKLVICVNCKECFCEEKIYV